MGPKPLIGTFALLAVLSFSVAAEPFAIVRDGRPVATIVVARDAAAPVADAARDLAATIREMSGATLPIADRANGPALVVGARREDRRLGEFAYHIRREGDRLYLSGGSDRGAINAAYTLLDRLGCRWYTPDTLGTFIPMRSTVAIEIADERGAPTYRNVSGFGWHPDAKAGARWLARNRIGGFPPQFHSHNWAGIVNPSEKAAHPEWFALIGGARSDQLCTTHPEVIAAAIRAARKYFDDNPGAIMFSMSPNDNGNFCRCDRCRALDRELGVDPFVEGGQFTDRIVYFINAVAKDVAQSHPGKKLSFYAYISHTAPPETVRPLPNVLPVVVHTPWEFCQNHPIDDPDCRRNARFAAHIRGWHRVAAEVYVYDYYGQYEWAAPLGLVHSIRRDMPWLASQGVTGFHIEGHGHWWTQTMNFYVPARLFWDLHADADAVTAEFYRNMFGPAAPAFASYGAMFQWIAETMPHDSAGDADRGYALRVTPEFLARAGALIDSGEALVRTANIPPVERRRIMERIRFVRTGFRMAEIQAPLERARTRTNAGEIAAYVERALALTEEIEADSSLQDVMELWLLRYNFENRYRESISYRWAWEQTRFTVPQRREVDSLFAAGDVNAAARKIGYVTNWRFLGMFPRASWEDVADPFDPATEIDFAKSYPTGRDTLRWTSIESNAPYGEIDLRTHFPRGETSGRIAYFATEVDNRGPAMDVSIRIGADDDVVLWVNGEMVLRSLVTRGLQVDQDRVTYNFRRGKNRVLVRLGNDIDGFEMTFRALKWDSTPLPALVWQDWDIPDTKTRSTRR